MSWLRASLVEHPILINVYYNDVVKNEDSNNQNVCIVVFQETLRNHCVRIPDDSRKEQLE